MRLPAAPLHLAQPEGSDEADICALYVRNVFINELDSIAPKHEKVCGLSVSCHLRSLLTPTGSGTALLCSEAAMRHSATHDGNSGPCHLMSLKGALGSIAARSMADFIFDSMHSFVVGEAPPKHNFEAIFD